MKIKETTLENLKKEKMPRKKKTWIFILSLGLPLLILGLALALVFGLNTDKQLDISLQGSGSFIVQNGQGEELEGENGKYVFPSGTEVSVVVSPDVGQEIESIFVNGEKLETTAESGESQIVPVGKIDKNTLVEIVFKTRTFDVSFVGFNNANLGTQKVEYGKPAIAPEVPTVEGHTFKNWDKDFSNITSDLTVTAVYELNTYTVIFQDSDGTELKKETVNWGENATAPENPTKTGHVFAGWFATVEETEVQVTDFSNIKANLTVKAKYNINIYGITASAGENGTVAPANSNVQHGDSLTIIVTPNEGYKISGILVDGQAINFVPSADGTYSHTFSNITETHTLSATFEKIKFEISKETVGEGQGSISGETTVEYGGSTTLTIAPQKGSYIHSITVDGSTVEVGASWGESQTYTFSNIKEPHTITVKFEKQYFTVEFQDYDGALIQQQGLTNPQTIYYGNSATAPQDPIREGYTFTGWFDGETQITDFSNITANLTVKAKYEINTFEISTSFEGDGEISGETTVEYGESTTLTIAPQKGSYIHSITVDGSTVEVGASWGESQTYTFSNVKEPHTITVVFKKYFTVVFKNWNGFDIPKTETFKNPQIVKEGEAANPPAASEIPEREGYSFTGWFDGETQITDFSNITSNLTLFAGYKKDIVVVASAENGTVNGETKQEIAVKHNGTATSIILNFEPNEKYYLSSINVSGISQDNLGNGEKIDEQGMIDLESVLNGDGKELELINLNELTNNVIINAEFKLRDQNFDNTEHGGITYVGLADAISVKVPATVNGKPYTYIEADSLPATLTQIELSADLSAETPYNLQDPEDDGTFVLGWANSKGEIVSKLTTADEYMIVLTGETVDGNPVSGQHEGWQYYSDGSHWRIVGVPTIDQNNNLTTLNIPLSLNTTEHGKIYIYGLGGIEYPPYFVPVSGTEPYEEIIVEKGVKDLAPYCFAGAQFEKIELPYTLESIGDNAFATMSSLESITFKVNEENQKSNLKNIGSGAFAMTGLVSVSLPEGLETIGAEPFAYCSNLKSISFPASLNTINPLDYQTSGSLYISPVGPQCVSLKTITVAEGNPILTDKNNKVLFSKDETILYVYALDSNEDTYTVPDGVITIAPYAFSKSNLESIEIATSVKTIGDAAFADCAKLSEVKFSGNNLTVLGEWQDSSITNEYVEPGVFRNCTSLTSIEIPSSVTVLTAKLFAGCSKLTKISINSDITSIDANAFAGCDNLMVLTIGESVSNLPSDIFSSGYLSNINEIDNGSEKFTGDKTFGLPTSVTWYFSNDEIVNQIVTSISKKGLYTTFKQPEKTLLGYEYLYDEENDRYWIVGVPALDEASNPTKEIKIPGTLMIEGVEQPIYGVMSTTEERPINNIFDYEKVIVDVPRVYSYALYNCFNIKHAELTSNVIEFDSTGFMGCVGIEEITVADENPAFRHSDDKRALLTKDGQALVSYAYASGEHYDIPDVYVIYYNAFYYCEMLESVTIPASVRSIYRMAFEGCDNLSTVTFAAGSYLQEIQASAFESCNSLTSISIPASVQAIGSGAFAYCGLEDVTINGDIQLLEDDAFSSCYNLATLTLSANVTRLPENLFASNNLGRIGKIIVETGSSLSSGLPTEMFNSQGETKTVYWKKDDELSLVSEFSGEGTYTAIIQDGAYISAEGWRYEFDGEHWWIVGLPSIKTEITQKIYGQEYEFWIDDDNTFTINGVKYTVDDINRKITYNDGQELEIENNKFTIEGVEGVEYIIKKWRTNFEGIITIPSKLDTTEDFFGEITIFGVKSSENYINLRNLDEYSSVIVSKGIQGIGESSFRYYSGTITFEEDSVISHIGEDAFYGCDGTISGLNLGNGITTISKNAFCNCTGLKTINLPSTLKEIGAYAFSYTGITAIDLPASIQSIGIRAFASCHDLTEFIINGDITDVGEDVLYNCQKLTTITLGKDVTTLYSSFVNEHINKIYVEAGSGITSGIPTKADPYIWIKNGMKVENFNGAGTYRVIAQGGVYTTIEGWEYQFDGEDWWILGLPSTKTIISSYEYGQIDIDYDDNTFTINGVEYTVDDINRKITYSDGQELEIENSKFVIYRDEHNVEYNIIWGNSDEDENITIPSKLDTTEDFFGEITIYGVKSSEYRNLENLDEYSSVVVSKGIQEIGEGSFYYYSGTITFEEGSGILKVGKNAFYQCDGLESITLGRLGGVYVEISDNAFVGSGLKEITLNQNISLLEAEAFAGCSSLTTLNLSKFVSEINSNLFSEGNLSYINKITVAQGSSLDASLPTKMIGSEGSLKDVRWKKQGEEGLVSAFSGEGDYFIIIQDQTYGDTGDWEYEFDGENWWIIGVPSVGTTITYNDAPVWIDNHDGIYQFYINNIIYTIDEINKTITYGDNQESLTIVDNTFTIEEGEQAGDYTINWTTNPERILEIPAEIQTTDYGTISIFGIKSKTESATKNISLYKSVTIPAGVEAIGNYAFYCCGSTNITFAEGSVITIVGEYAFYYCKEISINLGGGNLDIPKWAFAYCTNSEITFGTNSDIVSLGEGAFYNCDWLRSIPFGNLQEIPKKAFAYCDKLFSINIPSSVTEIAEDAFLECSSLQFLNVNQGNNNYKDINGREILTIDGTTLLVYAYRSGETYTIPESVTTINEKAFYNCDYLKELTIDGNITSIAGNSFSDCGNLEELTINGDIGSIEGAAFYPCESLKTITINGKISSIGGVAFKYESSLTTLKIGNKEIDLPDNIFSNLRYINKIIVGENSTINEALPDTMMINSYTEKEDIKWIRANKIETTLSEPGTYYLLLLDQTYETSDGFEYQHDGQHWWIVGVPYEDSLTIPNKLITDSHGDIEVYGIKSLNESRINGLSYYSSVIISEGIKEIGDNTFLGCSGVITFADGSALLKIGKNAFKNCTGLSSATFGGIVASIGEGAFEGCTALTSLVIGPGEVDLPDDIFSNHLKYINKITVKEGVTINEALPTSMLFPDGSSYESIWFKNGEVSESITESGVYHALRPNVVYKTTDEWQYIFENGHWWIIGVPVLDKTTITYGNNSYVSITNNSFRINGADYFIDEIHQEIWEDGGSRITIDDNNKFTIGDVEYTISWTTNPEKTLTIPASLSTTEEFGTIQIYGIRSLSNISPYREVIIEEATEGVEGIKEIGINSFAYSNDLKIITIAASVTTIGDRAFYCCYSGLTVKFSDGSLLTTIGEAAFRTCKLTSFWIPSNVETIGGYAFYNNSSLEKIEISGTITSIGESAFEGCDALTSLVVWGEVDLPDDIFSEHLEYINKITVTDGAEINEETPVQMRDENGNTYDSIWIKENTRFTILKDAGDYYAAREDKVYTYNGWSYMFSSGRWWITGVPATEEENAELEIKNELSTDRHGDIEVYGIKSIGKYCISNIHSYSTVCISEGIKEIGYYALYNYYYYYSNLTSIKIPSSVVTIGDYAFYDCSNAEFVFASGTGILGIGEYAFYDCDKLTTIPLGELEEGLWPWTISDAAFEYCSGLTKIDIPSSVGEIGDIAFKDCTNLETVTFTEGSKLESISSYAFENCSKLTTIQIPASVELIGNNPFRNCSKLATIFVAEGNTTAYKTDNNRALLTKDGTKLISYANASGSSYTIPASVTTIGNSAFYNSSLSTLSFEERIQQDELFTIEDYAFNHSSLRSIDIPGKEIAIGNSAFKGINNFNEIRINGNITSIGDDAFLNCQNLTTLKIGKDVTELPENLFVYGLENEVNKIYNLGYVNTIIVEEGSSLDKDLPKDLFDRNEGSYAPVWIKDSNQVIEDFKFSGSGTYYAVIKNFTYRHNWQYQHDGQHWWIVGSSGPLGEAVTIPNMYETYLHGEIDIFGIKSVEDDSGMANASKFISVIISDGIEVIGENTFLNCTNLTTLTINQSNITISGDNTFFGCTNLTTLNIGENVTELPENLFVYDSENGYNLGYVNTIIVELGSSLDKDLPTTLYNENGESYTPVWVKNNEIISNNKFDGGGAYYAVIKDKIYTTDSGWQYQHDGNNWWIVGVQTVEQNNGSTDLVIPNMLLTDLHGEIDVYGIKSLTDSSIDDINSYDTVGISEGIKEIGDNTFSGYTGVITFADGSALLKIGKEAFKDCTGLSSVTFGGIVDSIGDRAFEGCTALTSLVIGPGVVNLPDDIFIDHLKYINKITVTEGATVNEGLSSSMCYPDDQSYETVWIKDNEVKTTLIESDLIESDIYYAVEKDKTYTTDSGWQYQHCGQYWWIVGVPTTEEENATLEIPNMLLTDLHGEIDVYGIKLAAGLDEMSNASLFANIVIEEGIEELGDYVLSGCVLPESIRIPASVGKIGLNPFRDCDNLATIIVSEGNVSYKDDDDRALLTIDGSELISYAPANSKTSYEIPSTVTQINDMALRNCYNLNEVTINQSNITISGDNTFFGCTNLTILNIGENVTEIADNLFAYDETNGHNFGFINKINVLGENSTLGENLPTTLYNENGESYAPVWVKNNEVIEKFSGSGIYHAVEQDKTYTTIEGWQYQHDGNNWWIVGVPSKSGELSIPNMLPTDIHGYIDVYGIKSTTDSCISGIESCSQIVISDGIEEIGNNAFLGCTNLTKLTINEKTLEIKGTNPFADCENLSILVIGTTVEVLPANIFEHMVNVRTIRNNSSNLDFELPTLIESSSSRAIWHIDEVEKTKIKESGVYYFHGTVNSVGYEGFDSGKIELVEDSIENGYLLKGSSNATADVELKTGSTATFRITPNSEKRVATLTINGEISGSISVVITTITLDYIEITVENLTENISIIATFADCADGVVGIPEGADATTAEFETIGISKIIIEGDGSSNIILPEYDKYGYDIIYVEDPENPGEYKITYPGTTNDGKPGNTSYNGTNSDDNQTGGDSGDNTQTWKYFSDGNHWYISGAPELTETDDTVLKIPATLNTANHGTIVIYGIKSQTAGVSISNLEGYTSVVIDKNIKDIGNYAFHGSGITSVTFEENSLLQSIQSYAFSNCLGLVSFEIPASVVEIKDAPFNGCENLKTINFATGTKISELGESAFSGCTGLTTISIPASVALIKNSAFSGCTGLTTITIPANATTIGDKAFSGCSNLQTVLFEANSKLTSIGGESFANCDRLSSIEIPANVTTIGDEAFSGCSGLTKITINGNISTFGTNVFSGCNSLTTLTIGSGVSSLHNGLFITGNLDNLTKIDCKSSDLKDAVPVYDLISWVYKATEEIPEEELVTHFKGVGIYTPKDPITVIFTNYDGEVLKTVQIHYGGSAKDDAPTPSREGYTFTGWNASLENLTSDLTVTAQYKINTYTVTFKDWNGTQIGETQTVEWNTAATAPTAPTREGYTFAGWDVAFNNVTSNLTVTATYTIKTFEVIFKNINGETYKTQLVEYGYSASAPELPEVEGFLFIGWNENFTYITSNLTVTPIYKELFKVTISYDSEYGEVNFGSVTNGLRAEDNDGSYVFTEGANIKFDITTNPGCYVDKIIINDDETDFEESDNPSKISIDNITKHHEIEVEFVIKQLTVKTIIIGDEVGTITASKETGIYGDSCTITVTPNDGYRVAYFEIDGVCRSITNNNGFTYTFVIGGDHVVAVSFDKESDWKVTGGTLYYIGSSECGTIPLTVYGNGWSTISTTDNWSNLKIINVSDDVLSKAQGTELPSGTWYSSFSEGDILDQNQITDVGTYARVYESGNASSEGFEFSLTDGSIWITDVPVLDITTNPEKIITILPVLSIKKAANVKVAVYGLENGRDPDLLWPLSGSSGAAIENLRAYTTVVIQDGGLGEFYLSSWSLSCMTILNLVIEIDEIKTDNLHVLTGTEVDTIKIGKKCSDINNLLGHCLTAWMSTVYPIQNFIVEKGNEHFVEENGVLYKNNYKSVIFVDDDELPNGVVKLHENVEEFMVVEGGESSEGLLFAFMQYYDVYTDVNGNEYVGRSSEPIIFDLGTNKNFEIVEIVLEYDTGNVTKTVLRRVSDQVIIVEDVEAAT